jgi:hypothetical protein
VKSIVGSHAAIAAVSNTIGSTSEKRPPGFYCDGQHQDTVRLEHDGFGRPLSRCDRRRGSMVVTPRPSAYYPSTPVHHPSIYRLAKIKRTWNGHVGLDVLEACLLKGAVRRYIERIGLTEELLQP